MVFGEEDVGGVVIKPILDGGFEGAEIHWSKLLLLEMNGQ
ncbi:MAG: hypothetical protein ACJAQT_003076 [Akkermansiaceae bacterium]